jgi:hypothetical protein
VRGQGAIIAAGRLPDPPGIFRLFVEIIVEISIDGKNGLQNTNFLIS